VVVVVVLAAAAAAEAAAADCPASICTSEALKFVRRELYQAAVPLCIQIQLMISP